MKIKKEFSKIAIVILTVMWIVVAAVGCGLCAAAFILYGDTSPMEPLYSFVGAPMGCGLVGYFIKAAVENREKIKNNPGTPRCFDAEKSETENRQVGGRGE